MFKSLTESLNSVFSKLRGTSIISEDDFNLAMREIRIALIEADVSLEVAKKLGLQGAGKTTTSGKLALKLKKQKKKVMLAP